MSERLTPDICVIGGGAAGVALAIQTASAGKKVVLVEKDEPGATVRYPVLLQALVAAAGKAQAIRDASAFGLVDTAEPKSDFRKLARHLSEVAIATAPNRSAARLAALGITVLREEASFSDARTLIAGDHQIRARNFVIATGTQPVSPDIEGLETVEHLTVEAIFSLTRRPMHLTIVGGSAHALAFAQSYRRLGCDVTVITPDTVLVGEDYEQAAIVLARLRTEGVDIREHTRILKAERRGKTGVRLHVDDGAGTTDIVDGSHLLVLPERTPSIEGLGLDNAGVTVSDRGIKVDAGLRTSNKRIFAIGDVTGGPRSVQGAEQHAERVAETILSGKKTQTHAICPRAILTQPQIAAIGLSETEARDSHRTIRVLRWPFADSEHAQAHRASDGFVKLVTDRSGRLLGVSIVHKNASELISVWALAMSNGLGLAEMASHTPAFPTAGEIGKRAAISYFSDTAPASGARRILRILRLAR